MGNFGDYQYQFYKAGVFNKTSPFPFTFPRMGNIAPARA